jgi:hypothetical protein
MAFPDFGIKQDFPGYMFIQIIEYQLMHGFSIRLGLAYHFAGVAVAFYFQANTLRI